MYTVLIKKATTILCVRSCTQVYKPGTGSGLIVRFILPYSGKLSKNFANFAVLWLFVKVFPAKIWGRTVLWCGKSKQSVKVFSVRIVFFTNLRKFSAIWYSLLHVLINMWQPVVDSYKIYYVRHISSISPSSTQCSPELALRAGVTSASRMYEHF